MNDVIVKICGVRSPEIARCVAESGSDLMGLVFAPSKRQVSDELAREILDVFGRGDAPRPGIVGVFVNESVDRMNELAEGLLLDYLQLNGEEPASIQRELCRPVIRALRLPAGTSRSVAARTAERHLDCASPASALLIDSHVPGMYGGTGQPGDWELARYLAERYPTILAGGLRPDSVRLALESVKPLGVDVSSGVEIGGEKGPAKILDFIDAARGAARRIADRSTVDDVVTSR